MGGPGKPKLQQRKVRSLQTTTNYGGTELTELPVHSPQPRGAGEPLRTPKLFATRALAKSQKASV
eukprot:11791855-Alexandrium_andersonii.AAC.1